MPSSRHVVSEPRVESEAYTGSAAPLICDTGALIGYLVEGAPKTTGVFETRLTRETIQHPRARRRVRRYRRPHEDQLVKGVLEGRAFNGKSILFLRFFRPVMNDE